MPIIRQIAQLGQPILREPARTVPDIGASEVQALIDDLMATVADADGVGIAATQVNEPLAIFIIASRSNLRYPHAPFMLPTALINPEIVWVSAEIDKGWEGCLSVPGLRGMVPRHRRIGVRYFTRNGEMREDEYHDFIARIFQHEIDHIQGIVFVDRVEDSHEFVTEKEYLRLVSR